MNKKILIIGFVILYIVSVVSPVVFGDIIESSKKQISQSTSSNNLLTKEFYTTISGKKTWIAVRANFSEPTDIHVRFHRAWSQNGSAFYSFCYMISANGTPIISIVNATRFLSNPVRYAKIKFRNINLNFSHKNLMPSNYSMYGSNNRWFDLKDCTGYYDFIVVASSFDTTLEVWITASKNTTFSSTQGNDLIIIQRNDFDSTFNVGCRYFTFIKNGERKVKINNTFFAWFDNDPGIGYLRFEYQTPTGKQDWMTEIDNFEPIYINKSDTFDSGLLGGPKGIWTFKTSFWEILSNWSDCPNLYLVGVDVKLC